MILSIYRAPTRCDTHVAPLGLWSWLGRACYRHAAPLGLLGLWVRHALRYTLRSSGAQGLEGSSFYRHIAPLERKTYIGLLGLWVGQDTRPTAGQPQGLPLQRPTQCIGGIVVL